MQKTLSIIVPTYNMESLVGECLDSVLGSRYKDRIQVVAVNDGSRDRSLEVLRSAERKYPQSMTVVDKPNGNYGSAINAGLEKSVGKYVRILDADDRYDTAETDRFMEFLDSIPETDLVVGPYTECSANGQHTVGFTPYARNAYEYGRRYDANHIFGDGRIPFLAMHSIAYRTELIKSISYHQTEGISYTDQEWTFMPLFHVGSMVFYPRPVYLYNTAREGQTMNPEVQMRSIGQMTTVSLSMARYYMEHAPLCGSDVRTRFLRSIVERRIAFIYRKYLMEMDERQFASSDFSKVDRELDLACSGCGICSLRVYPNPKLHFDLLGFWRRHLRRPSPFTLKAIRSIDRAMYRVYGLLYR